MCLRGVRRRRNVKSSELPAKSAIARARDAVGRHESVDGPDLVVGPA